MREALIQFKKIFTSAGFYISTASVVILFFCAEIYSDHITADRYSVINALISFDREEMLQHVEFSAYSVFSNARSGWFTLFIPLCTSFCFVPIFCAEHENNALRFQLVRSSKLKFYASRYLAGVLSGGFSAAAGYAVFGGVVLALFPGTSEFPNYFDFQSGEEIAKVLKMLLGVFIYGILWSMPSMFCTSFMKNKYLIMCIPFFVKYGTVQIVQLISQRVYSDPENIDKTLAEIINMINPEMPMYIENYGSLSTALFCGLTSALLLIGFTVIQKNRRDQGA